MHKLSTQQDDMIDFLENARRVMAADGRRYFIIVYTSQRVGHLASQPTWDGIELMSDCIGQAVVAQRVRGLPTER